MIQLKFLSDGVAGVGLLLLRLFARVILFVKGVKNALVKRFTILFRFLWVDLYTILEISWHYVWNVIMMLLSAFVRK